MSKRSLKISPNCQLDATSPWKTVFSFPIQHVPPSPGCYNPNGYGPGYNPTRPGSRFKLEKSHQSSSAMAEREEDDDYMGDLSRFLSPEASGLSKKVSNSKASSVQPSRKKPKALNWQEQRKIDRERKQQEEDEKTLANIEAPIPQSNVGFRLLKQMGYTPGTALGKEGAGRAEPVKVDIRRSRAGIGREDPHKEKRKREVMRSVEEKRNEESLMEEFESRKKSQWRIRRVVVNFNKAKAVLEQLENKEVVPLEKEGDEEEEGGEEEEELITEEDLQVILMKLRDEHRYCLFCGCQYESMEELLSTCPGTNEDDH